MVLFMMFMAALNFLNRNYFCIYFAAAIFLLSPNRKIRLNASVMTLLIFSVSILIFNPDSQDTILDMIKPFTYPLCYFLGISLFQDKKHEETDLRKDENRLISVIYVMAGGTILHFFLNMITNWETTSRAELTDFWTKSEMSATAQAALASLGIAVIIAFLLSQNKIWRKLIAISALALILYYNLILAGRTLFILVAVILMAALLYVNIIEKRKMIKPVVAIIIAVIVFYVLYNQDLFGIKTVFESSNFYMRFYGGDVVEEIDNNTRLQHKAAYLKYFLDYPWGGDKIRSLYGSSAHDLYLDTYNESGIFALITIVIYIVSSLIRLIKYIRCKNLGIATRTTVLCVYLACNIYFWLEPILRGIPWLLMAYCFVDGAVTYLLMREKNMEDSVKNILSVEPETYDAVLKPQ